MSAEVENNKDEEAKPEPIPIKKSLRLRILAQWQVGFKLLELVLAVACLAFIYEPANTTGMGKTHFHHIGIMYTSYTGSIVIIIGLFIGRIVKDQLGFKTSFIFSTTSAALFLTTGVLLATDKSELTKNHFFHPSQYLLNMMLTSIILTFINAFVFIADAVFTFVMRANF